MNSPPSNTPVVTVPDPTLLADVSPPDGVRLAMWDVASPAADLGADADDVVMVVLPYFSVPQAIGDLATLRRLRHVQTQTAGFDGLADKMPAGVTLSNAGGVHDTSTAEVAVGLAIAGRRRFSEAVRDGLDGTWGFQFQTSLADRRVLLVGVGGVGAAIARRLEPFEVSITRVASRARNDELSDRFGPVHGIDELLTLLPEHDVVILAVPLNDVTRGLFGARELAAMPDDALLVNVARGAVVDTDALTAEIVSGRLRGACDVIDPEPLPPEHPLWRAPNFLLTPHIGGSTSAFRPRVAAMLQAQLAKVAAGERVDHVVVG